MKRYRFPKVKLTGFFSSALLDAKRNITPAGRDTALRRAEGKRERRRLRNLGVPVSAERPEFSPGEVKQQEREVKLAPGCPEGARVAPSGQGQGNV